MEALRQVRQFKGHRDRITGLVVSQDAKWLLSASMDGTVRIWDVPAAACLQACHFPLAPCFPHTSPSSLPPPTLPWVP